MASDQNHSTDLDYADTLWKAADPYAARSMPPNTSTSFSGCSSSSTFPTASSPGARN